MTTLNRNARQAFKAHGGILRTTEAMAAGIHPRTLYAMRDAGQIEALARGVYRLAGMPPLANPDLATVAKRIPARRDLPHLRAGVSRTDHAGAA